MQQPAKRMQNQKKVPHSNGDKMMAVGGIAVELIICHRNAQPFSQLRSIV